MSFRCNFTMCHCRNPSSFISSLLAIEPRARARYPISSEMHPTASHQEQLPCAIAAHGSFLPVFGRLAQTCQSPSRRLLCQRRRVASCGRSQWRGFGVLSVSSQRAPSKTRRRNINTLQHRSMRIAIQAYVRNSLPAHEPHTVFAHAH